MSSTFSKSQLAAFRRAGKSQFYSVLLSYIKNALFHTLASNGYANFTEKKLGVIYHCHLKPGLRMSSIEWKE